MATKTLSLKHIARVEGHGNVTVEVEDGALSKVELNVTEPVRVFESMVKGRPYDDIAYIASRICGICSSSHVVTSLLACEDAFGIEVSERTRKLRELLCFGSYLQNHATHLYIFAAPDFINEASVFPLAKTDPETLQMALSLKKLGNDLCCAVGGRSIHPTTAVVGGFTAEPQGSELEQLADRLEAAVDQCVATGALFASFEVPDFKTAGDFLALVSDDGYAVCGGQEAALIGGWRRDVSEYRAFLSERTVPYSNAKLSLLSTGTSYMVGAIARINLSYAQLTQQARLVAAKSRLRPKYYNPFKNNVSQAIELVDVAQRCADLCRELAENPGNSTPVGFEPRAGKGVGATEAPRGTVYHELGFDESGRVVHADILTPTAQNLANLENDIRSFASQHLDLDADEFRMLIEKLVRAYDPCLSCAVH